MFRAIQYIGNQEFLKRKKTLFVCSKRAPMATYEKIFGWVESQTKKDVVMCCNTTELEQEVQKSLLVNEVPTILVVMNPFEGRTTCKYRELWQTSWWLLKRAYMVKKAFIAWLRQEKSFISIKRKDWWAFLMVHSLLRNRRHKYGSNSWRSGRRNKESSNDDALTTACLQWWHQQQIAPLGYGISEGCDASAPPPHRAHNI